MASAPEKGAEAEEAGSLPGDIESDELIISGRLDRRFSATAISRYRECPRACWFQYVAKIPRPEDPSPSLVLGTAVHAALDRFFGMDPDQRTEEMLHTCLRSCWRASVRPGTFVNRAEEAHYGNRGLDILSRFLGSFDARTVPVAREQWLEARLSNGVFVFGKVDRVDAVARQDGPSALSIVDYKTGRRRIDPEDLIDDPAAQIYTVVAQARYKRDVDRVRLLFVEAGEEVRWDVEPDDVADIHRRLVAVTDRMVADETFAAWPGEHCRRCPYLERCPDAQRVDVSELEVPDEILF